MLLYHGLENSMRYTERKKDMGEHQDLEKGKYYVQIAMLGSEDNIRSTIKKYGKQYPITLVPLASGKG